jgi:hypothetical protein
MHFYNVHPVYADSQSMTAAANFYKTQLAHKGPWQKFCDMGTGTWLKK